MFPGSCQSSSEQETGLTLSCPVKMMSLSSPAKLQLVTGWTPHMSGKGGEVPKGKEGEKGGGKVRLMAQQRFKRGEQVCASTKKRIKRRAPG